ncbi:hypothetical protein ACVWZK_006418 [Bradyrhizobium sp. GM0.4]
MKRYGFFAVGMLALTLVAAVAVLGFDVHPAAAHGNHLLHTAEFGALAGVPTELKSVFDRIGEAFEAFKKTHTAEIAGVKKGFDDVITKDQLKKVEDALDAGVEAKAKLEAAIDAERKEREDLEMRLNREGIKGSGETAVRALEIKTFNNTLAAAHADRKQAFTPLDEQGYDAYKSAFNAFMRKNERMLTADGSEDPTGRF